MNEPIHVGELKSIVIQLLSLPLPEGTPILLGISNIEHMKQRHPYDFEKYFDQLIDILADPDYVTINPRDNSVRYLKHIGEMVHVGVKISAGGNLFARTLFIFPPWKVRQYKESGLLFSCK